MLNAALQEEKQTQQRMKKAQQQPNRRKLDKNW
jgi:Ca-activated chloride channel family protein